MFVNLAHREPGCVNYRVRSPELNVTEANCCDLAISWTECGWSFR